MKCKICGKEILFDDKRLRYCSSKCAHEALKKYWREREKTPERRAKRIEYQQRYRQRKKLEAKS